MNYVQTVAPANEPVTLVEAKVQSVVRTSFTADDDYITLLIAAARRRVESDTRRALIPQSWRLSMQCWLSEITLRYPPVIGVTQIQYMDTGGVLQLLDSAEYQTGERAGLTRICPAYSKSWPPIREGFGAVLIDFEAGYVDGVPEDLRLAILMLVAHWYEHREPAVTGTVVSSVDFTYRALIEDYVVTQR